MDEKPKKVKLPLYFRTVEEVEFYATREEDAMSRAQVTPKEGSSVLDLMLDPISRCLDVESAKKLIDLRINPAVQERVDVLAEKANEGLLTEPERAEYEAIINTDDFISTLKLKARRYLTATDVA